MAAKQVNAINANAEKLLSIPDEITNARITMVMASKIDEDMIVFSVVDVPKYK